MFDLSTIDSDTIVGKHRSWNNSMALYSDYATIYNVETCSFESTFLGVDFLDSHKVTINKDSAYVALHQEFIKGNRIRWEQKKARDKAEQAQKDYGHHGPLLPGIVALLDKTDNETRDKLSRLLCVKRFRSKFRRSLCDQVLSWVAEKPEKRRYPFPLSPRQMEYL